jgi:hypothetical protein
MSHVWLAKKILSDPTFPRPLTFGSSSFRYFRLADVEAWERTFVKAGT